MLRLRTASPNGPRLRFEAGGQNAFAFSLSEAILKRMKSAIYLGDGRRATLEARGTNLFPWCLECNAP